MIVSSVVQLHAEDAALLAANRQALIRAPHARLQLLRRADRRLKAHLAGLRLAGEHATSLSNAALEKPSPGAMFVVTVGALENHDEAGLARVLALAQAVPETTAGLLSAFGWVDRTQLQGMVAKLLRDHAEFNRMVGLAVCAIHRIDPGIATGTFLQDPDPAVRARSFRAAGELGLSELLSSCTAATGGDGDPDAQFWAAWSGVLLGDRRVAVDVLTRRALFGGRHRARSFRLALQAMSMNACHEMLKELARDPQQVRRLIQGSGIAGDSKYVPWLIKHMSELGTARLAGEAFALITGVDLGGAALDRPAPANFEPGPTDDPDDPNVDPDPDDDLPWPDVEKIETWWASNTRRFQQGSRNFMGAPVTWEHCIEVLKNGYQRQRILAAHYLCLLNPGTPLFNTSAPAWRQQRQLAKMS